MTLKTKKIIFAFAVIIFFRAVSLSVPVPEGKGKIGFYNSPMSHSRTTSNVSFPYPSNKWFGSIFTSHNYHLYSFAMTPSPMTVNLNTNPGNAAQGNGYLLGYPSLTASADKISYSSSQSSPRYFARISGLKAPYGYADELYTAGGLLDGYSDWSATFLCRDRIDETKWIKTTIGRGFIFTYNEYSQGLKPLIVSYYDRANTVFDRSGARITGNSQRDCILVKTSPDSNGRVIYYAVFAPADTSFSVSANASRIEMSFAADERYLSAALITAGQDSESLKNNAVAIFNEYYQYAYNFITDTKVSYSFDKDNAGVTTVFNFTTQAKRAGAGFSSGTVFALFPHQWKNSAAVLKPDSYNFRTLKGTLKVGSGSSFTTQHKFCGIMPNLTYEVPESLKSAMQTYINYDRYFTAQSEEPDTYYSGKALAKAANLIPILHQFGDIDARNRMIENLKAQLRLWYTYTGQPQRYFAYDSNWGGLIGRPYNFGSENYADHHFHYGYFIYASAILALFDPSFADVSEYKGMVDLLVKDIQNHKRNDADFPFLRHFDVYEGHSWANGAGGGDDRGIDQESSSESMNAWAGIYLWGLACKNRELMDLGAYGYTTEYEASKEYFFDMSGEIYGGTPYAHKGVGILWENEAVYNLHFEPRISQTIKGIQVLPLTPSMLYLGYNTDYARAYYDEMLATAGFPLNTWKDIWLRYKALFDAPGALNDFSAGGFIAEQGSSLAYSYHFINFFNAYGSVDTGFFSDGESFCVMNKSGQRNYIAFNNSADSYKTVVFKSFAGGALAGSMSVPPMTTAVTKDFVEFKYDSLRTMHSQGNSHVILMDSYSDKNTVKAAVIPPINELYYKSIPFVFSVNSPGGLSANTKAYVKLPDISIPSGYAADQIKLAVYNPQTRLPESVYPHQNIIVEAENAGKATVLIEASLTKTGIYVVVIPTGVQPPGLKIIRGFLRNAKDSSGVEAAMRIYNSSDNSETSEVFNGIYEIEVIKGASYTIKPSARHFIFEPESYSFTVGDSDLSKDFAAFAEYELGGKVSFNGRGLNKINISIYDIAAGSTRTVVTADGGKYKAAVYYAKSYIVTPVSAEYDFTSEFMRFDIQSSFLYADFLARVASGRFVVYPNPYKPSKHGNIGITFTGLKSGAEIKIYNIAGELVFDKKTSTDGGYTWYAENNSGYQAGSGVYVYYIKSDGKTRKGKIAVER